MPEEELVPEVKNVRIRIPASTYAFIEAELPRITTLAECFQLADKMKKDEKDLRYSCEHLMATTEEGKSQFGRPWKKQTCPECGAERFYNFGADIWQPWKFPIRG